MEFIFDLKTNLTCSKSNEKKVDSKLFLDLETTSFIYPVFKILLWVFF